MTTPFLVRLSRSPPWEINAKTDELASASLVSPVNVEQLISLWNLALSVAAPRKAAFLNGHH